MSEPPAGMPAAPPDGEKPLVEATELARAAPLPAVHDKLVVGTAGWTEPTLLKSGLFYPGSVKTARQRLGYYSSQFSMVEVDASYYTLIAEETSERWCQATPPGFTFHVKAHPVFTGHPIDVRRLPVDLREELTRLGHPGRVYANKLPPELVSEMEHRFFSPLRSLEQSGKLGVVLLQFPPWFTATRKNARAIEGIRNRYPGARFAVEFRHKSWLEAERRQRVLSLLRVLSLTYVCVDEPEGPVGGVPPVAEVTTEELALVRFHGRNRSGWAKRGASVQERFDYLYSSEELSEWLEPTRRLASEAERVHAVFNNCVRNYAVLNAKGLVVLLGAREKPC